MYTIGSDPELFIVNTKTGKVVSAIGKIPGTKDEPFTEGLPEGFGLQTDNILAEFNIPPVSCEREFIRNMEFMKDFIREKVKAIDPDLDIMCAASAKILKKELKHPQAMLFGCDEDYCIYTGAPNPKPQVDKSNTLRSAGMHCHVGYHNNSIDTSVSMLFYVDAYVGLPSIIYDTDTDRRSLYGQAGCFRLQKWGFEYRTLSGWWLDNPIRLTFVYRQLMYALSCWAAGVGIPDASLVRNTINNNDVDTAKKLVQDFSLIYGNNVIPE